MFYYRSFFEEFLLTKELRDIIRISTKYFWLLGFASLVLMTFVTSQLKFSHSFLVCVFRERRKKEDYKRSVLKDNQRD